MNYQQNGQETNAPQGGENQEPGIWGTEKRCDDFYHAGGCGATRRPSDRSWYQSERTDREICQGEGIPGGSEIVGGTLGQLIEDCREQIAGNDTIINTLQGMNQSLEVKIRSYQRLMQKIAESQE